MFEEEKSLTPSFLQPSDLHLNALIQEFARRSGCFLPASWKGVGYPATDFSALKLTQVFKFDLKTHITPVIDQSAFSAGAQFTGDNTL